MRDFFPFSSPTRLTSLAKPISNYLGLQTIPFHLHEIAAGYVLYDSIFRIFSPLASSKLFPKHYGKLDKRGKINWDAHVVSMVQSCLINSLALWCIFKDPGRAAQDKDWRERLWGYNGGAGMVQGLAAGYFLWDVVVSALHLDVMGPGSLAHGISALGVTLLGFKPFANYYGLNFILYELSTPFLNIHWFCDKLNATGSKLQLYNGIALLATFFLSRLVWGTYQTASIYSDVYKAWIDTTPSSAACDAFRFFADGKLGLRTGLDVPTQCRVLPKWLAILYVSANSVLGFLNFYWFGKMVEAVRKRFVKTGKKPGAGGKDKGVVERGRESIPEDIMKELETDGKKEHFE